MKAFPSTPLHVLTFEIGTVPDSEPLWDALVYFFSQYPSLTSQGITGYSNFAVNTSVNGTYFGGMNGVLVLPALSSTNTSDSLIAAFNQILDHIVTTWPSTFVNDTANATVPSFYDFWILSSGPTWAGISFELGSRLLDERALTVDLPALKAALKVFTHGAGAQSIIVGGGKVNDIVPRGGSDAVNSAWRKTIVHLSISSVTKEGTFGTDTTIQLVQYPGRISTQLSKLSKKISRPTPMWPLCDR